MAAKLRRLSSRSSSQSLDRRGSSIIYIVFAMFVITGIVSFGVDIGWIRVARNQLQTAADASALAGALSLPDSDTAAAKAEAIGMATNSTYNTAGTAVSMLTSDVELGFYWPPNKTFYLVGQSLPDNYVVKESDSNAMRVTGQRTAARANPLPLFFARIFKRNHIDVTATATAYVKGGPTSEGFGIVGLTAVTSNGTKARIDSYLPPNFTPTRANAKCASNGNIDLGNADVYGDARPGVNMHVIQGPTSVVTGYTAPLTEPLVYPPVTIPGGATPLGNFSGLSLAPGTYSATKFDMDKNFTITGSGIVNVYVNGDVSTKGNTNSNSGGALASNLRIFVKGNHNIEIKGNSDVRCWIYAPEAEMQMNGTTDFYGAIVAGSLEFKGVGAIHYDESHGGGSEDNPFTAVLIK